MHDDLQTALTRLVESAEPGTRIPTVRALMKRYGVGQASVQEVLGELKLRGLITSHVGRGTYVAGRGRNGADRTGALDSLLILSNVNMNDRCARVQATIVAEMQAIGARVLQMSYSDTDHLLAILKGIPRFDAVVLQSHYESIPVRLLAMLHDRAGAVVIDGLAVSGVDIDTMGIDWEEALDLALAHLVATGRRRPALVALNSAAGPIRRAARYFRRLQDHGGQPITTSVHRLTGLVHPTQDPRAALAGVLDQVRADGADSLIFLGLSDTGGIDVALRVAGLRTPDDMAAVVLGHVDVDSEHLGHYTVAGAGYDDGARALLDLVRQRLDDPGAAPRVRYLETRLVARQSSASVVPERGSTP